MLWQVVPIPHRSRGSLLKHLPQILAFLLIAGILACASQPTPAGTVPPLPTATPPPTPSSTIETATEATPAATPTNPPAPTPTSTPMPTATPDSTVTPEPTPTATPEPTPTATPEPTPTATTKPTPTATPEPTQLDEIPCGPDCVTAFEPVSSKVAWLEGPSVTATGRFSFIARIDAGHTLVIPDIRTTGPNVVLSENAVAGTDPLYGTVMPPLSGGYRWTPNPGLWVADVYEYRRADNTLQVAANIDPAAAAHRGLRVCIWTGGGTTTRLLGCTAIN